jgi:hypothetical protein
MNALYGVWRLCFRFLVEEKRSQVTGLIRGERASGGDNRCVSSKEDYERLKSKKESFKARIASSRLLSLLVLHLLCRRELSTEITSEVTR